MITKEQLNAALNTWDVARESALLEQRAWGTLTQSHGTLISSLRQNGHTWSLAQAEFEKLSNAHSDALLNTWRAMDDRRREYQRLYAEFNVMKG